MSPASRLKLPVKRKPDLEKPVRLGFDPTQAPTPPTPSRHENTLRLYEPEKERKITRRRAKVKYPEPTRPEFNKGRL